MPDTITIKTSHLKYAALIIIACLLFLGGYLAGHRKDLLEIKKVTENPSKDIPTITETRQGKLSGTSKGNYTTIQKPHEKPQNALQAIVPVKGEVTTVYTSKGKEVGRGIHEISGETKVTVVDDAVTAETTFDDTVDIGIEVEQKQYRNHIGGGLKTDFKGVEYGGYYQRDFPLTDHLKLCGRIEYYGEFEAFVGVELSF